MATSAEREQIDFDLYRKDEHLLVSVLRRSGFHVVDVGQRHRVVGDGDSMSIYQTKSGWHYRRWSNADEHGSVFDALVQYGGAHDLGEAIQMLGALPPPRARREHTPPRRIPPWWSRRDAVEVSNLILNPRKYAAWRAYKPLAPATIDRWSFGLGVLPSVRCGHQRLVYPVYVASPTGEQRLVNLRGRAIPGCCPEVGPHGCPKWTNSKGSRASLWNIDGLTTPVGLCVIAENPVDAALWMQEVPDGLAVAPSNGVASWSEEWTGRMASADRGLAARGVRREYCVWLDNGVEGNPPDREVVRRWRDAHPDKTPPTPAGALIVRSLVAAGCRAYAYRWPPGTPTGHDLGAVLMEAMA